jgi:hypothetical protein
LFVRNQIHNNNGNDNIINNINAGCKKTADTIAFGRMRRVAAGGRGDVIAAIITIIIIMVV